MSRMNIVITAQKQSTDDDARIAAEGYLSQRGYKRIVPKDSNKYVRGSLWGTLTGFSPRKWKSNITFTFSDESKIQACFDINTTGQMVTESEREFWRIETNGLQQALEGTAVENTAKVEKDVSATVKNAILYAILFSVVGGAIGIIFEKIGVASIFVPSGPAAAGLGAGLGAFWGARMKVKRKE